MLPSCSLLWVRNERNLRICHYSVCADCSVLECGKLLSNTTCHIKCHNIPEDGNSELPYVFCEVTAKLLYLTYIELGLRAPCGGGLEYLHRSSASRKRWQKGNPVPGGITGATLFLGEIHTGTCPQVGEVWNLRHLNVVMSPTGNRPEKDCADQTTSNSKWQTCPLVRVTAP
jgi:hypothetical protein